MTRAEYDFQLVEHRDGTINLYFEDSMHGDDILIRVNADGTLALVETEYANEADYEGVETLTPITNVYAYLAGLLGRDIA